MKTSQKQTPLSLKSRKGTRLWAKIQQKVKAVAENNIFHEKEMFFREITR